MEETLLYVNRLPSSVSIRLLRKSKVPPSRNGLYEKASVPRDPRKFTFYLRERIFRYGLRKLSYISV